MTHTTLSPPQDRPVLGIFLMLGFCVVAPLGDGITKFLGDHIAVAQFLVFRFAVQVVILLPLAVFWGLNLRMSRRVFWISFLRAGLHILGIGFMFTSLQYLEIADAVAIAFVMPFILLFLGWFLLGESVGPRRIIAATVGFIGTLFIVQPSFYEVGWPALFPIAVAFVFAFFMLVTRTIAKEVDPITLQGIGAVQALVILAPLTYWGAQSDLAVMQWVAPSNFQYLLLALLGVLGTVAHLMMTWSLRFAPSTTLAPMQYLEIPVATFVGWMMFRDLPNGLATLGILITISAGLYMIHREAQTARNT